MNIVTNVLSIRLLFSIAITNYSTPVTIELVVGSTEVGFLNIKAYQYFLEKLFNLINITVVYKKVDTKFICYCLNKDVVEHIEEYGDNFNSNKMAIWLEKFVHFDKNISSKYIKKNMIEYVQTLAYITIKYNSNKHIIYAVDECKYIEKHLKNYKILNMSISKIISLFLIYAGSFVIIIRNLSRYNFKFSIKNKIILKGLHYVYLYGTSKNAGFSEYLIKNKSNRALFISPYWSTCPENFDSFIQRCNKNQIKVLNYKDFCYDLKLIYKIIKDIYSSLHHLVGIKLNISLLRLVFHTIKSYTLENIYLANYHADYILCHDDLTVSHFVKTAVHNMRNIKTYGIQHSGGNALYGVPQLAYINYDTYFVWNKMVYRSFSEYWKGLNTKIVGYPRITDSFLQVKNSNGSSREILSDKYFKKTASYNVLITLPTLPSIECIFDAFIEFMKCIDSYVKKEKDINIIIRPKLPNSADKTVLEPIFKYIPKNANVAFSDGLYNDLTYELIDWSDITIASNSSGVITEACILNKQVVTYDYTGCLSDLWMFYGSDMYLSSRGDVFRILTKLTSGKRLSVNYHLLYNDLSDSENNIEELLMSELTT